jgi:CO/xanthine dehydrogenase Mo-binding subunit
MSERRPASTIVGASVTRLDGVEKVTGRAVYGVDVTLAGMLTGKLLRSPLPHARIRHIDAERARRVMGVRAILTGRDTPQITYGFFKHVNPKYGDKLPLEVEKVRFVGDEVAAVAAESEEAALEALSLIEVDYEELPAVFTVDEALAPGAALVHDGSPGNIGGVVRRGAGDVAAGWRAAAVVLERRYSTHAVAPACLESHQAVASFDSVRGAVTVWASTQMPFQLRAHLADALGLPEAKVRIIKTTMGAGFGSRMEMHAPDPVAALLSQRTRRPVKIVYTRGEEFVATRFRHAMRFDLRMGFTRDGRITAAEARAVVDGGAYMSQSPGVTSVAGTNPFTIYRIPAFTFEGTIVYTNKPYAGAFRGYGNPQGTFAIESMLDEAAAELGLGPAELRRRSLYGPGDVSALGFKFASCAQRECLEAVVAALRPDEERPRGRGVGIAGVFNPGGGSRVHGNSDGCGAILRLDDDGSLQVITGGQEIGQGSTTVLAQIAAETVGVSYGAVRVESSDTSVMPWDLGTHGSRNTFVAGNAVAGAGRKLNARLREVAAELLGGRSDDVVVAGGRAALRDRSDRSVSVSEIARAAHFRQGGTLLIAEHFYDPPTEVPDAQGRGNKSGAYAFGFHGVEVAVDEDTGEVRIERIVAAHDIGRTINPRGAESQVEGGIAQGIGYALTENLFLDDGRVVLSNFGDYKIPAAGDLPPKVEVILVESDDPEGPYGAKGVAEPGIVPVAAAIANAVAHATGSRIRDLPITPEKVLDALEGGRA